VAGPTGKKEKRNILVALLLDWLVGNRKKSVGGRLTKKEGGSKKPHLIERESLVPVQLKRGQGYARIHRTTTEECFVAKRI